MGFTYSQFGLCCDFCGKSKSQDNVKKIPCPYGYCQAWVCCTECKAKKLHLQCSCTNENKTHEEICKDAQQEHTKRQLEKQKLLKAGYYLRCAALRHHENLVKVLFENKNGDRKAFFMTKSEYDKIPLLVNARIEDYEMITECLSTDINEAC